MPCRSGSLTRRALLAFLSIAGAASLAVAVPGCLDGPQASGRWAVHDECTWTSGDRAAASAPAVVAITGERSGPPTDTVHPATAVINAPDGEPQPLTARAPGEGKGRRPLRHPSPARAAVPAPRDVHALTQPAYARRRARHLLYAFPHAPSRALSAARHRPLASAHPPPPLRPRAPPHAVDTSRVLPVGPGRRRPAAAAMARAAAGRRAGRGAADDGRSVGCQNAGRA
jgi:hypothetical protein